MRSLRKSEVFLVLAAFIFFPLFSVGCGKDSQSADAVVPSFCPAGAASQLDLQPLAENIAPKAYFQDLEATVGENLDITLLVCDPDNPETAAGMTWFISSGPSLGVLSTQSGVYSTEPYQVTYIPESEGPDLFYFFCLDAEGALSNQAEVRINNNPPASQNLYFGGRDDLYRTNLWYYDGISPIATIAGSAQALSANGIGGFKTGVPFQSRVHFIVIDTTGEGTFVADFDPATEQFRYFPQVSNASDMEVYNSRLYVGGASELWSTDGSGTWTSLSGAGSLFPYGLKTFGSKLYFSGGSSPGVQLWSYDGSVLAQETNIGTDLWPIHLTECNGNLYFNGTSGPYEYLWSMDGISPAATVTNSVTSPENMICFNSELYFTAMGAPGSTMPVQLWSVDSGDNLTRWTTNVSANFMFMGSDTYPVILGTDLYMRGNDDAYTNWIWAHDGSSPISTVAGSDGLFPFETTVFNNRLYFSSTYLPAETYDQLGSYDPGAGAITTAGSVSSGLSPEGFVVYPP